MNIEIPRGLAQAVAKELAQRSLHEFIKQAWAVVEPDRPFSDNWHIKAICSHLEAVDDGRIKNLIINVPPGTMKSLLVCVFWPAWSWSRNPSKRFMFASYSDALTMRDSVRCRNLLTSPWFQARWPIQLRDDQNTKGLFENTSGGWRLATSVGGRGTGLHPDFVCLAENVLVKTNQGSIPIGEIVNQRLPVKVLSYSHEHQRQEWSRVLEYERNPGRPSIRIRTKSGASIECTDEHPVFVKGKGYTRAGEIRVGEVLLKLREDILLETESESQILQSPMQQGKAEAAHGNLLDVRKAVQDQPSTRGQTSKELLLQKMFWADNQRGWASSFQGKARRAMRHLREAIHGASLLFQKGKCSILWGKMSPPWKGEADDQKAMRELRKRDGNETGQQAQVLQQKMCIHQAQDGNKREKQREICAWSEHGIPAGLQANGGHCQTDGQGHVHHLRNDRTGARKEDECSPRGLQQGEQQPRQSFDLLPILPRKMAREELGAGEMEADTVVAIDRIQTPKWVYNLNVEGNHNYYADGILVHNCADDANNATEAESEAERNAVIDWWDGAMSTRGISRSVAQLCIQQRLHTQDLTGHLLTKGTWEQICLPMRFEQGRMQTTSLGFSDPRRQDGELLWPALFTEPMVTSLERTMGIYHAAGQLQQRPTPRGGGMFKREWFKIIPIRPNDIVDEVRAWDKAGTASGDGARTAGTRIARRSSGRFLITHVVKGRWGATEREAIIKQTAQMDGPTIRVYVEQEPGSGGKESAEATVRNLAGFTCIIERVTGAKEVRAEPLAAQASIQNVDLLLGDWNEEFLQEIENFPVGALKDQVDAAAMGFNKLAQPTGAWTSADVPNVREPEPGEDLDPIAITEDCPIDFS